MRPASIGDVRVFEGEPQNPHQRESLMGERRRASLAALRDGGDIHGLSFWHVPYCGTPSRITNPAQVNWETM